ncbi:prephenate dehydratase domain-containing protein [Micrococcus luteus]|uniref:prephenate dehydratase domain-containing protein n=1 Tax=Micrococcus luteus TaxID=1270 RepID=UPI0038798800
MPFSCEEIHTLGPEGTNCATAAGLWNQKQNSGRAKVVLHETLEKALEEVLHTPKNSVLLGCVVYPDLHKIVFNNLNTINMVDQFIMPTHSMVLAARDPQKRITSVVTHPAPRSLVENRGFSITETTSNSQAALECSSGNYDACITTSVAAKAAGLTIIEDAGQVPMGFSIHQKKDFIENVD